MKKGKRKNHEKVPEFQIWVTGDWGTGGKGYRMQWEQEPEVTVGTTHRTWKEQGALR